MLKKCSDILFAGMGNVLSCLIPWKVFILMWPGEAFTMVVLYKNCAKKQHLFPSTIFSFPILACIYLPFFYFFIYFFSVKLKQGTVTSLLEVGGTIKGVEYKTKTGQEMTAYAPLTVVCDGCFSSLRHLLCKPKVKIQS